MITLNAQVTFNLTASGQKKVKTHKRLKYERFFILGQGKTVRTFFGLATNKQTGSYFTREQ